MRTLGASVLLAVALGGPAHATGEISCMHPAGAAIDLLVSRSIPPIVDRAIIYVNDEVWTTSNEMEPRGVPISVGQSFEDDRQLFVDIMSDDRENFVARLRVFYAEEGRMRAGGGTLQVVGKGAWAVDCTEPG